MNPRQTYRDQTLGSGTVFRGVDNKRSRDPDCHVTAHPIRIKVLSEMIRPCVLTAAADVGNALARFGSGAPSAYGRDYYIFIAWGRLST
jgi:hypothetical protein